MTIVVRTRLSFLNLDQLFGKILNQVNEENTIVCYASDHGEMLSDHGDVGKTMPWSGSVSVPLACSGPGIAKGKIVTRPVSTMDLAATFLDFGRAEKPEGNVQCFFASVDEQQ